MKEDEGSVTEAADIIQELQVETYGSMEKREKVIKIMNIIIFLMIAILWSWSPSPFSMATHV